MRILRQVGIVATVGLAFCASSFASGAPVTPPYMMSVRILDESAGAYQVEVDNMNPYRFIRSYVWTAPPGMTIIKITSTIGGKCLLQAPGTLTCNGSAAGPKNGSQVGESMLVDFTATGEAPKFIPTSYGGYYIHYGVIGSVSVQMSTNFGDLPLCKNGEKSTKTHLCSTS